MSPIRIIAGKPGAGKHEVIGREICDVIRDPNNIVYLCGNQKMYEILGNIQEYNNVFTFRNENLGSAIGKTIDMAARLSSTQHSMAKCESNKYKVYLYISHCYSGVTRGYRDMLAAASKAGAEVCIIAQRFSQVCENDAQWLREHGDCYVVSKHRPPRLATLDERKNIYW